MKHLTLIAGLAIAACAFAAAPKAATAAGLEFTPYLDLRASIAETYTKEKAGETAIFGKGSRGTFVNYDNGNFILGNSNVGAKFKADKITGEAQIMTSYGLDKYWAEYDAGFAKFLIGKLDPMCTIWTNQAAFGWDGLGGYGVAWSGREKQIKMTIGGLYIDLMPSNAATDEDLGIGSDAVLTPFPKTNIGYTTNFGDSMINVGGIVNYNKFRKVGADANNVGGETILAYMGYVNAKIVAGAISIIATADCGINEGNMGFGDYNGSTTFTKALLYNGSFKNTLTYEGGLEFMYKIDPFSIGAGAGYVHSENSSWKKITLKDKNNNDYNPYPGKEHNLMSVYVEGIVPVGANVTLYPEVSYFKTVKDAALDKSGEEAVWAGVFINYLM